jgi:hypothetical protein
MDKPGQATAECRRLPWGIDSENGLVHKPSVNSRTTNLIRACGVGANRGDSASCDETGRINFSFFIYLSFALCPHSSRLVLRFYDSPFQSDSLKSRTNFARICPQRFSKFPRFTAWCLESTTYVRMRRPTFVQDTSVWAHWCNYCATETQRGLRSQCNFEVSR